MESLSQKISSKTIKIVAIVWLVAILASVGYCMGKVKGEVGMEVFDLKTTYNAEYATQFLDAASEETIDFYRSVQIPVDYTLAIMLGVFPIVCMLYMKKKIKISQIFILIACGITILDATENTMLLSILNGNIELANVAGIVTLIKNLCMYTTYVALIAFTVKYRRAKKA